MNDDIFNNLEPLDFTILLEDDNENNDYWTSNNEDWILPSFNLLNEPSIDVIDQIDFHEEKVLPNDESIFRNKTNILVNDKNIVRNEDLDLSSNKAMNENLVFLKENIDLPFRCKDFPNKSHIGSSNKQNHMKIVKRQHHRQELNKIINENGKFCC